MELIAGQTLRDFPLINLDQTIAIASAICRALAAAYEAGNILKDIMIAPH